MNLKSEPTVNHLNLTLEDTPLGDLLIQHLYESFVSTCVISGVPQGSGLGSLLFSVNIRANDNTATVRSFHLRIKGMSVVNLGFYWFIYLNCSISRVEQYKDLNYFKNKN